MRGNYPGGMLIGLAAFLVGCGSVQGRVLHVAADGSRAYATIQAAAEVAQPGDTVLIHAGVYRERVTPPRGGTSETERISYAAAADEVVVIKGSEVWKPKWIAGGANVFHAYPDDALFNDDVYNEGHNPFRLPLHGAHDARPPGPVTLGQVFVDGERYNERFAETVAKTPKTWYYNKTDKHIYIHFPDADPNAHTVEITTRRSIFRPHIKGLGYIAVRGLVMEHCGNNAQFGVSMPADRSHHAALDARGGHHWIIENCTVRHAKSQGIDIGGYSDKDNERDPQGAVQSAHNIVRNCDVSFNGLLGIGCSMKHDGSGTNCKITGNWVEGNAYLRLRVAECGGIKTHQFHDSLIADNAVVANKAAPIWVDWFSGRNSRVTRNIVIANAGLDSGIYIEGIFVPTDRKLLVDNNIVLGGRIHMLHANSVIIAHNYAKAISVSDNRKWVLDRKREIMAGNLDIHNNLTKSPMMWWLKGKEAGLIGTNRIEKNVAGAAVPYKIADKQITVEITPPDAAFTTVPAPTSPLIQDDYLKGKRKAPFAIGPLQKLRKGKHTCTLWPK